MKNHSFAPATTAAALALFLGVLAHSYAGPGPQFWTKAAAPAPANTPAATSCDRCPSTPQVVTSDRGPAGKGVARTTTTARIACPACEMTPAPTSRAHSTAVAPATSSSCGAQRCCPGQKN